MRSAKWLVLALFGQAAALQLIDAGVLIHYQHYRLPPQAAGWALAVVALQAVSVALGLAGHRQAIGDWLRNRRNALCLVAGIALCGYSVGMSQTVWA